MVVIEVNQDAILIGEIADLFMVAAVQILRGAIYFGFGPSATMSVTPGAGKHSYPQ